MDNLESKTKKELIEILESKSHLSEAVDAKDTIINDLKKRNEELVSKSVSDRAEITSRIKSENEKIRTSLEHQVADLKEALVKYQGLNGIEDKLTAALKENEKYARFINIYVSTFQNYLKSIQGQLENTIELQAILVESLKK